MSKAWDEVISEILVELDKEHSEYQRLFKKFYGKIDTVVKQIYDGKVSVCEEIRKRIISRESREKY